MVGIGYGNVLTLTYIMACLFFTYSIKKIVKDNRVLIIIFAILLFNPISYSSDLFQRLYRNSISYIEILFFLGAIINIIASKKNNILNYAFLGFIVSAMFLTKEDNIWTKAILIIVIFYKFYKEFKFKNICINLIPILIIAINLNIVSYFNYKNYKIYSYNELNDSSFKDAYIKILQIKDDEKINKVAIPKSTFYKLAENSKVFGISKKNIDDLYTLNFQNNEEINNSNIIWVFRMWMYRNNNFKDGKEADEYFHKLSDEIDELFKQGKLEKKFALPSVFMNPPSIEDIKLLPKNLLEAVCYTSTYKNIKTYPEEEMVRYFHWDEIIESYKINYYNSHKVDSIIDNNPIRCEILRKTYAVFTVLLSVVSLFIYFKNITKKDSLNFIIHIILFIYLIIICGVTYTHTTAFDAIRYCYLGNIYLLQSLFILLNLYRQYDIFKNKKKLLGSGEKNDFSNNTSI